MREDALELSLIHILLDCTLESKEALEGYAVHPDHVAAADTYVRPYTDNRVCLDFEA